MIRFFEKTMPKALSVLVIFSMVLGLVIIAPEKTEKVDAALGWNLVWSDEFNGTALDTSVWSYDIGNGSWGWGNGEVEYYTSRKDNVKVSDGFLQIIAKRENYGGQKYTSGRIKSIGKKYFKYGKMEAKIKVENGNQDGVWPAYWMMGENMNEGTGWPYCGEIDIMEHANSNHYIGGCLHWNTNGIDGEYSHGSYGSGFDGAEKSFGYFTDNVNNGINGWHTYTLIWDENHMEWQLDGKTFLSQKITSNNAYCFQKEHFFLFNLAIGGTGTGFTNNKTANEATFKTTTMYVDYLRVYQMGEVSDTPGNPSTTKQPTTTKQPETITHVSEEDVDLVSDSSSIFGTYFSSKDNWGGNVTGTVSNATNTGIQVNMNNVGNNRWAAQASLGSLKYYPGYTYTYSVTLTSDKDRTIQAKVVGNDDGNHDSPILYSQVINLKAGVPYNLNTQITIPSDYQSELYLYFGLGKDGSESISEDSANTITISNASLKAKVKVITSEIVTTKESGATQNSTVKNNATSSPKVTVKKPGKAKITSAKNVAKRSIKLKLKKIKGAKGYLIRWCENKKFQGYEQKRVTKTKYTIKKLEKKQKYYIKVKAYKLSGKTRIYGKWSKVKRVTVKK